MCLESTGLHEITFKFSGCEKLATFLKSIF